MKLVFFHLVRIRKMCGLFLSLAFFSLSWSKTKWG